MKNLLGWTLILSLLVGAPIALLFGGAAICGDGSYGFGSEGKVCAKILSKHVDPRSGAGSSYMVTTDKGTFEIENGFILGVWNADDLYGGLEVGESYALDVRGDEVLNFALQQYPFVVGWEKALK